MDIRPQYLLSIALKATADCVKWLPEPKPDGRLRDPLKVQESVEANRAKITETAKDYAFSGTLALVVALNRHTRSLTVYRQTARFIEFMDGIANIPVLFNYYVGQFTADQAALDASPIFIGVDLAAALRIVAISDAAARQINPKLQFVVPGCLKLYDPTSLLKTAISLDDLLARQPFELGRLKVSNPIDDADLIDSAFQSAVKELVYVEQCLEFLGV
jgi:hypothetical protein